MELQAASLRTLTQAHLTFGSIAAAWFSLSPSLFMPPEEVSNESEHLGYEKHHQRDVGGEDDGERSEGEGGVLLRRQDHSNRSRDQAQHLQGVKERQEQRRREKKKSGSEEGKNKRKRRRR